MRGTAIVSTDPQELTRPCVEPQTLPTAGTMTRDAGGFDSDEASAAYDAALDERQEATLY